MPLQTAFAFLEALTPGERAWLVIGVTVIAVTGTWARLYRRGKK